MSLLLGSQVLVILRLVHFDVNTPITTVIFLPSDPVVIPVTFKHSIITVI